MTRHDEHPGSVGEMRLAVHRPADGTLIGEVPILGPTGVRKAVHRARAIQAEWSTLDLRDRVRRMAALLPVLARRSDDIARTIQDETGKPLLEALSEVAVVTELVAYFVKHAPKVLRPRSVSAGLQLGKSATIHQEPYGVVGVISPWNYPFILTMEPAITGAFAGNAVVIKPSEFTPFTARWVPELFAEAHLPDGLVQIVTGDGASGQALIQGGVDKISFTGSTATGKKVMAAAAESLTPVQLELGGKDPAIVLGDADVERAGAGIAFGAFFNAGQTCISVELVFAVESVYESFVHHLSAVATSLRTGTGEGVDIGPMTTIRQLETVEAQLDQAVRGGARVLSGGSRSDPASNVLLPTVIVDVTEGMDVLEKETFGPVVAVVRVRDEDEAVRRANEGRYGLCASVWSSDLERGERVARRLKAGCVSVNDVLTHYSVPSLPMGGVGESGFGRTRGAEGLLEMSRTRSVLVRRHGLAREPYWFPYRDSAVELIRGVVDWRGGRGPGRFLRSLWGRLR